MTNTAERTMWSNLEQRGRELAERVQARHSREVGAYKRAMRRNAHDPSALNVTEAISGRLWGLIDRCTERAACECGHAKASHGCAGCMEDVEVGTYEPEQTLCACLAYSEAR